MSDFRKLKVWRKAFALALTMGVIPRAGCDSAISQSVEVKKMLHGLINSLGPDRPQAPSP